MTGNASITGKKGIKTSMYKKENKKANKVRDEKDDFNLHFIINEGMLQQEKALCFHDDTCIKTLHAGILTINKMQE